MITDTHAHLDYPVFQADFAAVLDRAEAAGVKRMISIGTSLESSRRAVALAESDPRIFAAVGVHPNATEEAPADTLPALRELARHPRVVAVGEIGLDYHRLPGTAAAALAGRDSASSISEEEAGRRDKAARHCQAHLFEQQLDLAVELGLNAVIHQRVSWDDTLSLLSRYTGRLRAVFHCFGESLERAEQVLALGHLVSFTGIVTFKNAQTVHATAAALPDDAFMVETDCPYLAPAPFRGQRCEPAHTRLVAERLAVIRQAPLEKIAASTERTANAFFRFPKCP